jgi:hypothetical protein
MENGVGGVVGFMSWYRYVVAGALVMLWVVMTLGAKYSRSRYFTCLVILAACYPLGKTLQAFECGPRIVRWYLSDIGFVAFVGYSAVFQVRGIAPYYRVLYGIMAGLTIALVTEWFQLVVMNDLGPIDRFTARGDWMDVYIFIVTAGFAFWLSEKFSQELRRRQIYRRGHSS